MLEQFLKELNELKKDSETLGKLMPYLNMYLQHKDYNKSLAKHDLHHIEEIINDYNNDKGI